MTGLCIRVSSIAGGAGTREFIEVSKIYDVARSRVPIVEDETHEINTSNTHEIEIHDGYIYKGVILPLRLKSTRLTAMRVKSARLSIKACLLL